MDNQGDELGLIKDDMAKYDDTLYYLVGVMPDGSINYVDGSHSTPQGVAKARDLYQSIGLFKDMQPKRWAMVTVSNVPDITDKTMASINRDAISTINDNLVK